MYHYNGRQSAKAVERDFPHFVDIVVPPHGLGKKLNGMYEFHTRRGIKPQRGQGRHDANGEVIRWCFADPANAHAFAAEFR
jgi:hypothetical protein